MDAVNPNAEITYGDFDYELTSLICHWGSLRSGHFWAYVKDRGNWIEFNDSRVVDYDINNLDQGSVYMIIYQKRSKI
jgi:ubiquitin C-terminal hydrolase